MVPSLYVPSLQSHAACPLLLSLSSPLQRTRKGTHANLQCTVTSTFLRTCRLPRTTAMFTSQLLVRQLGTNSSKHNIRTYMYLQKQLSPRHGRSISCHSEGNNLGPSVTCHRLSLFPSAMEIAARELQGKTKDSHSVHCFAYSKNVLQLSSLLSFCIVTTTQIHLFNCIWLLC